MCVVSMALRERLWMDRYSGMHMCKDKVVRNMKMLAPCTRVEGPNTGSLILPKPSKSENVNHNNNHCSPDSFDQSRSFSWPLRAMNSS